MTLMSHNAAYSFQHFCFLKRLNNKILCPSSIASVTILCWRMAVHMMTFALGSKVKISRSAFMPFFTGIVISIVTRSGRSFYTGQLLVHRPPLRLRLCNLPLPRSLIFTLMNLASSTTKTLVIFPPTIDFHR